MTRVVHVSDIWWNSVSRKDVCDWKSGWCLRHSNCALVTQESWLLWFLCFVKSIIALRNFWLFMIVSCQALKICRSGMYVASSCPWKIFFCFRSYNQHFIAKSVVSLIDSLSNFAVVLYSQRPFVLCQSFFFDFLLKLAGMHPIRISLYLEVFSTSELRNDSFSLWF